MVELLHAGCGVRRLSVIALVLACLVAMPVVATAQQAPEAAGAGAEAGDAAAADTAGTADAAATGRPEAAVLAEILRDDAARERLIAELERVAAEGVPEPTGETGPDAARAEADPAAAASVGRLIAVETQAIAEDIAGQARLLAARLANADRVFRGLSGEEAEVLVGALVELALVIAATVGVYLALRVVSQPLYRRMGASATQSGVARAAILIAVSTAIDVLVVLLAWAAGYVLALTVIGSMGEIGIRQTLYLNAFLIVELVKAALRAVLSPSTGQLRFIAIPDGGARRLNRWLAIVIGIIGYGQLLIVPIINENVSFFAGRSVSALLMLFALIILAGLVITNRRAVAEWLLGARQIDQKPGLLRFLARRWHWPALVYLLVLFVIVVTRPGGVLWPVLIGSAQLLGAIVAGAVVTGALRRAVARRVRLPEGVTARLPLLEARLNAFVPTVLTLVRFLVFLAVAGYALDMMGFADIAGWLESEAGVTATAVGASVATILLFTFALWLALTSWIDYRLNPSFGRVATAREETLLSLLRNAVTIAMVVITLMFVLSEIGIDIAPLIASAGVLGLAIGFGAQKLVQDIITGVFIQLENAINVGDVVTAGGTTGTVERLTIRSVSLRDLEGVYHIIPFSSVDMVSNYMRGFGYFVCDMGVAYRENIDEVKQAMIDAFAALREDPDHRRAILGDFEWFGLNSFGDSAVVVRARIKCAPGKQWGVGRAYNEIAKRIFDERGIEIPFPHQTIYFGEDRQGAAPPARIVMQGQ